MTLEQLADTIKKIKDSGLEPTEYIDSEIKKHDDATVVLRQVRNVFSPPTETPRRTWSRKPKPDTAKTGTDRLPESADDPNGATIDPSYKIAPKSSYEPNPIALKIATLLRNEGPKRVSQIVASRICSDPTARNHLKAPYFTQRADLSWELTNIGKSHFFG